MKHKLHVVAHTHWDREWYKTFQQFRLDLVRLVDHVLDLLRRKPSYRSYMLDGQAIVLDDYLELRPERRNEISDLVRAGRLQIGPWYVLADEFLASGEVHVHNMQMGIEACRRFGRELRVGYLPDQFGHISQMPQILNQVKVKYSYFSRGARTERLGREFWWRAPDGSRVLAHTSSYANSFNIPADPESARKQIARSRDQLASGARTRHLLLMNGFDHMEPLDHLPEALRDYREHAGEVAIHTTLEDFFRDLHRDIPDDLKEVTGELRDGGLAEPGWLNLFSVNSSRMHNKQANHHCQQLLERWAEPFNALAWLEGSEHPKAALRQAWEYLLENQAHDSICGCSADRVHRQMTTRFEWSEEIAEALARRALDAILSASGRESGPPQEGRFAVVNPSPRPRSDTVTAILSLPPEARGGPLQVTDARGRPVTVQRPAEIVEREWKLTLFTLQTDARKDAFPLYVRAEDVPAVGYRVYALKKGRARRPAKTDLRCDANWIENKFLRVSVRKSGAVDITHKETGRTYDGCNVFEDDGDVGGGYEHVSPTRDQVFRTAEGKAHVRLVERGPLLARLRVELTMRLPTSATRDRKARGKSRRACKILSYVTLAAGSRRVDFRTTIHNTVVDHRLRVLFPTNLAADAAHVDQPFDVVTRPVSRSRKPSDVEPQKRFVDLSDGKAGFALINVGLPEYEVTDDPTRTISLTLFRSHTFVARPFFPDLRSPEGEMLGEHTFEYAACPHAGDWDNGAIHAEAESANLPMRVRLLPAAANPMAERCFVAMSSQKACLSIIEKCRDRNSLLIRAYNPSARAVRTAVRLGWPVAAAYLLDLRQRRLQKLRTGARSIPLTISSKKILTVECVPRKSGR